MKYSFLLFSLAVWWVCITANTNADEFAMQWQGTRRWAGPEAWASPLYDWRVEDGKLVATAGLDRLLQSTVWRVGKARSELYMETSVRFRGLESIKNKEKVWAGFAIAITGLMDDQRHVLVGPKSRLDAGVRGDGRLFIGNFVSEKAVELSQPFTLLLVYNEAGLRLAAMPQDNPQGLVGGPEPLEVVEFDGKEIPSLLGNIALAAVAPESNQNNAKPVEVVFDAWAAEGDALVKIEQNAFGPILWSQYTRQKNDVKLLAMLAPMGEGDPQSVSLQVKQGDNWKTIDTQDYDPLTFSALLRGTVPDGRVDYRVVYRYLGEDRYWHGTFIADPAMTGEPLRIGVFSCDHGYAFPLPTMVANVKQQRPNLLFFAGDQIYEGYGGFRLKREPTELAMLDYLRKYYQFGWTWRDVLANTPSIIIPDDHDVFQGNLWGANGRWTKNINDGGYAMSPDWVNGIQRTQTAHLPDAHDPTPVQRGIGVYYTALSGAVCRSR